MKKKHVSDSANGARVTIMVIIICLMCVVGVAAFSRFYFTVEHNTMERLDFLAKAYYEDYYYDLFMDTVDGDKIEKIKRFEEHGFAPVYLRQLLSFNDGKYSTYRSYFDGICDTNTTLVYYYPHEPYGKTDYEIKYVHSCNFE